MVAAMSYSRQETAACVAQPACSSGGRWPAAARGAAGAVPGGQWSAATRRAAGAVPGGRWPAATQGAAGTVPGGRWPAGAGGTAGAALDLRAQEPPHGAVPGVRPEMQLGPLAGGLGDLHRVQEILLQAVAVPRAFKASMFKLPLQHSMLRGRRQKIELTREHIPALFLN
jgi:hypothetical protein